MRLLMIASVVLVLNASIAFANQASYEERLEEALATSNEGQEGPGSRVLESLAVEIKASIGEQESSVL